MLRKAVVKPGKKTKCLKIKGKNKCSIDENLINLRIVRQHGVHSGKFDFEACGSRHGRRGSHTNVVTPVHCIQLATNAYEQTSSLILDLIKTVEYKCHCVVTRTT